jgi:DNA-binding MarR family transcriptional regulator
LYQGQRGFVAPQPIMSKRSKSQQNGPHHDADRRVSARALDLDHYIPAYLTYLAGKISSGASSIYRPKFGIGITDWRIMAMLASEPWIGAARICNIIGLDKAAVSRSVRVLQKMGIIDVRPDETDQRRQAIALTRKGVAMHDKIVQLAIAREQKLIEGFTAAELRTLIDFLLRLQRQVRAANAVGRTETVPPGRP